MSGTHTVCNECGKDIVEYYNDKYHGRRGRCSECSHDFPLE